MSKFKCVLFCVLVVCWIISLGEARLAAIKKESRSREIKINPKDSDVGIKYRKLLGMHEESLIKFDFNWDFHTHIVQTPRNYSAFVLFNYQSDEDCEVCPIVRSNLNYIRYFYLLQHEQPAFFFVEVVEEPDVSLLRQLRIRSTDLPVLVYVPEYGRLEDVVKMDDNRISFNVKDMVNWISGVTGVRIHIVEDTNLQEEYGMQVLLTLMTLVYVYKFRSNFMTLLTNDTYVAIMIMATVIYFLSGCMYNLMNGVSFMASTYSGSTVFIHPSSQRQLWAESILIFVLYSMISYGMILMSDLLKQPLSLQTEFNSVFYVGMSISAFAFLLVYGLFGHKLSRSS